jgi:hypothetical protein
MGLRPTDGDEERMRNGECAAKFGPFFRGAVSADDDLLILRCLLQIVRRLKTHPHLWRATEQP